MPDFDYKCRHPEKRRGSSNFLAFIYSILLMTKY